MRINTSVLTVFLVLASVSAAPAAEISIGSVLRCEGPCADVSAAVPESLKGGEAVRLNEKLSTGADGRLDLAFDDGTHVTLGEKAEVVVDTFVYRPAGTSRFHAAIIGVRGTDFWGGPSNGVTGIVVFEGSVAVTTASGSVILSAPGEGTNVPANDAPPSPVTQWSEDRIAAAVASVAFH